MICCLCCLLPNSFYGLFRVVVDGGISSSSFHFLRNCVLYLVLLAACPAWLPGGVYSDQDQFGLRLALAFFVGMIALFLSPACWITSDSSHWFVEFSDATFAFVACVPTLVENLDDLRPDVGSGFKSWVGALFSCFVQLGVSLFFIRGAIVSSLVPYFASALRIAFYSHRLVSNNLQSWLWGSVFEMVALSLVLPYLRNVRPFSWVISAIDFASCFVVALAFFWSFRRICLIKQLQIRFDSGLVQSLMEHRPDLIPPPPPSAAIDVNVHHGRRRFMRDDDVRPLPPREDHAAAEDQDLEGCLRPSEALLCPISSMPFHDPVITCNGTTYERNSIQRWFESNGSDPTTGLNLPTRALVPNFVARQMADEWRGQARLARSTQLAQIEAQFRELERKEAKEVSKPSRPPEPLPPPLPPREDSDSPSPLPVPLVAHPPPLPLRPLPPVPAASQPPPLPPPREVIVIDDDDDDLSIPGSSATVDEEEEEQEQQQQQEEDPEEEEVVDAVGMRTRSRLRRRRRRPENPASLDPTSRKRPRDSSDEDDETEPPRKRTRRF